jgi:hypothetical protein
LLYNVPKIYEILFQFLLFKKEIFHNYDRDKTLLAIEPPNSYGGKPKRSSSNFTDKDRKLQIQKWLSQLKFASEKVVFYNICLVLEL